MLDRGKALYRKVRRRLWMKYALRGVNGRDNHARLDLAYRIEDPWNMQSPLEQARFAATSALIAREFEYVDSLLELGCGEGHQSLHLAEVAERVHGLDVSPTAILRARLRVPDARFEIGTLESQSWFDPDHRVDLVTACEMLYAVKDVEATVARMRSVARACLITTYAPGLCRIAPYIADIPGLRKDWIYSGSTVWLACWWRND